jgi:hypothetical protein
MVCRIAMNSSPQADCPPYACGVGWLIVTAILAFAENWTSRKRICFIFGCESAGQHNQLGAGAVKGTTWRRG